MGAEAGATISCSPGTRNKVREIRGHGRTYDELLQEWIKEHEQE
jgi:hypothetical protein